MSEPFNAHRNPGSLPEPVLPILLRDTARVAAPLTAPAAANNASTTPSTSSDTAPASLAHRAVETVLNVVTAQDSRPPMSGVVNLHFKFGGADLSVRVQLRGDEVHTQFNTDSTDLRAALANEWRGVSGQTEGSSLRLAEPVFASSSGGSDQGFGSPTQGQAQQQNSGRQPDGAPVILPALHAFAPEAVATATPAAARGASLPTSLHLAAVA